MALLVENNDDQIGVNLFVLEPGQPMAMYHWEADQEGFLVLSGEALLIVGDEERPLRAWDYFHCPPNVPHTIVGAGTGSGATGDGCVHTVWRASWGSGARTPARGTRSSSSSWENRGAKRR